MTKELHMPLIASKIATLKPEPGKKRKGFMIKFHPETTDYQKKLLRVNLKRLSLTRQDCINIEKIINFTVKHPAQAVLLSNCSQTIKDMLQPTKKDIEAINKMVL